MKNNGSLKNKLLKVSDRIARPERDTPSLQRELRELAARLVGVRKDGACMTPDHVMLIARLFYRTVTGSRRTEPIGLLTSVYDDLQYALDHLHLVVELIEMGIIDCDEKRYRLMTDRGKTRRHALDAASLVDVYIELSDGFMSFLLNGTAPSFRVESRPFANNIEFLEHWFKYVEALRESRRARRFRIDPGGIENDVVTAWERLERRANATRRQFPFQRLCAEYDLRHDERVVVIHLLHEALEDNTPSERDLCELLTNTKYDKFDKPSILTENGTLRREGIIQSVESHHMLLGHGDYEIAPDIACFLLSNKKRPAKLILENMIKHEDLLATVRPAKRLADLVLPPDLMQVVRGAISKFKNQNRDVLCKWGVVSDNRIHPATDGTCDSRLVLLLYGPPGTGKTALAHALARTLKRPLLVTDVARILDKWIGESEKRLTRLFLMYRRIARRTGQAPVLLLNEADQLISRRGGTRHAADRMYNQMQNILLEQLETFRGVLIATTNLVDNIDSAFSRRFDLKLALPHPGVSDRKRLWRKLIPKTLPLADDVDLNRLAGAYAFTGGQIEVVIRNAATAAADRCRAEQIVRHDDLVQYAEIERTGSFDHSRKATIGFA